MSKSDNIDNNADPSNPSDEAAELDAEQADEKLSDTSNDDDLSHELNEEAEPEAEELESEPAEKALEPATIIAPATTKKQSGLVGKAVAAVAYFALLGGAGAYGYWSWQNQQAQAERIDALSAQLGQQFDQISATTNTVSALQNQSGELDRVKQTLNQQQQDNQRQQDQVQAQLRSQAQRMAAVANTTTDDWKLAEAYYLVRLAGQRLLVERSTIGALALLQAADDIVKTQSDPQLISVREQLAVDILALKLVNNVDREGIYLRLAALKTQLQSLPNSMPINFSDLRKNNEAGENNAEEGEPTSAWRRSMDRALGQLKGLVEISHHDQALEPLPSPEYQAAIKSRLILLTEMAQLSLLEEQTDIYQNSLGEIEQLLRRHYPLLETRPQLLEEITQLKTLTVRQQLPTIYQSQQLLGDYLDTLHQVGAAN